MIRARLKFEGEGAAAAASSIRAGRATSGSVDAPIQVMRGSRRNHTRWRRANWRGRVIAVGTTSVRVLESLYGSPGHVEQAPSSNGTICGTTGLYITPGYCFKAVDALITNFHLPRTSLLALVMAFGGVDRVRDAYAEAIRRRYRFFSFGDAMFLEAPSANGVPERRQGGNDLR